MNKISANYKLIVEVPESELIIDGLNIEFFVRRSSNSDADTAYITIWNLDEESFKLLILREQTVNLYIKYSSDEPELLFSGYLDNSSVKRKRMEYIQVNNEPVNSDIKTCIKLVESKKAYQNTYINEDYRDEVSAEQIIQDCISAMELGSVQINIEIPPKTFSSYKAVGKPHQILYNLCNLLGINIVIQNGIINLGTPSLNNNEQDVITFNNSNSLAPQFQGNDSVLLVTSLTSKILPNNVIRCEFDNLENLHRVINVDLIGNNFDNPGTSYITIGLDNNG